MNNSRMRLLNWSSEEDSCNTEESGLDSFEFTDVEPVDSESYEDLLARALKSITFDEQQSAIHDIHGVSEAQEDPKMVQQKLMELEEEICKITSKQAYLQAKAISPAFVQNSDFRLLFLRSDLYNAKKSAVRLVSHFEIKKKLFGEQKLGRDIMLHDLEPEEWKGWQTRWLQHRDRSGRVIFFWTPQMNELSVESRFRLIFWSILFMLKDEETRKYGMVLIFYNVGSTRMPDPNFFFVLNDLKNSMPNPIVSFHICYDNPRVRPVLSLLLNVVDTFMAVRCRSHYGSAKECIYSLLTFGIPREALPITDGGKIIPMGEDFFLRRLQQEQQPTPKELVVIIPGRFDVMLGRQKRCQDHVGNLRYRHLVLSYQNDYENSSKNEKTAIAEKVVQEVHDRGGHFLEIFYEDFIEVSDIVARKKVAHAFRSQRRIQNRRREFVKRASGGSPASPVAVVVTGSESDASVQIFSNQTAGKKRVSFSSMEMTSSVKRVFEASVDTHHL